MKAWVWSILHILFMLVLVGQAIGLVFLIWAISTPGTDKATNGEFIVALLISVTILSASWVLMKYTGDKQTIMEHQGDAA